MHDRLAVSERKLRSMSSAAFINHREYGGTQSIHKGEELQATKAVVKICKEYVESGQFPPLESTTANVLVDPNLFI